MSRYFATGNFVKIIVRSEKKEFILNEKLLCDKADYFKAAFRSGFKESQEKQLELPEDNPDTFARFVEWLYTNEIKCSQYRHLWGSPGNEVKHDLEFFGLWVFGDKIRASDLTKAASERCKICFVQNGYVASAEGIEFVYSNTTERSQLRELLVNATVQRFYGYAVGDDGSVLSPLIAAHEKFGAETMRRISKHLGAGVKGCLIEDCCIHGCISREFPSEDEPGELPRKCGYDGDDGDYF